MDKLQNNIEANEYVDLLKEYVDLCEEIISCTDPHPPSLAPFYAIWNAYKKRLGAIEVPIEVMVYDDTPCAKATMKFCSGDISIPHESCECNAQWRVSASYLRKILENPDYYKTNPAQLDWSWLQEVG